MRMTLMLVFCGLLAACGAAVSGQRGENAVVVLPTPKTATVKQPVLVELFTSEGCSSCPPAERELALLDGQQPIDGAEIIALEMHVDYWDDLGWKDPFASRELTDRQQAYTKSLKLSSNYTPQMIVDGATEFVGSDGAAATRAISDSIKRRKATVKLDFAGDRLRCEISELESRADAEVMLAITEDDLATDVGAGENSGRRLVHRSVVRQLRSIGAIAAGATAANVETKIGAPAGTKAEKLRLVVFVQEKGGRRVLGAARIAYAR